MVQINALRVHIQQGCLSDIEPGGGTNFNEALHRHINSHFNHAGRMGLPLAYALLTILLYIHNCKKESPRDVLGLLIAAKLRVSNTESTVVPFGIVGNGMKEESEEGSPQEKDKGQVMTDEGHSVIDIDQIVRKALASADLAESMGHIIDNSPTFSYHMMPFMSGVPTLCFTA